jgi:hypothetical protein
MILAILTKILETRQKLIFIPENKNKESFFMSLQKKPRALRAVLSITNSASIIFSTWHQDYILK